MVTQRKPSLEDPPGTASRRSDPGREKPHPRPEIVGIEEAPAFLIDNKHLRKGYRKNFRRMPDILASLCQPHNETLNIWTHLIGSIVAIWAVIFVLGNQTPFDAIGPRTKTVIQTPAELESLADFWKHLSVCPKPDPSATGHAISRVLAGIKDLQTQSALQGREFVDMNHEEQLNQGILAASCDYVGWLVYKTASLSVIRQAEELIFGLSHKLTSTRWEFRYIRDKLVSTVA